MKKFAATRVPCLASRHTHKLHVAPDQGDLPCPTTFYAAKDHRMETGVRFSQYGHKVKKVMPIFEGASYGITIDFPSHLEGFHFSLVSGKRCTWMAFVCDGMIEEGKVRHL